MMSSLNITLRGHSTKCHFPERAMVYVTIESTGEYEANTTARYLQTFLASLCFSEEHENTQTDIAVSSFSYSPILVTSKGDTRVARGSRTGRSRIYNAVITICAVFCDFKELQNFIMKIDEYPNAKLDSVSWFLTGATEKKLGGESRNEAVLDAVMKAKQYAQAAGFERATVKNIKEIAPETGNSSGYPQRPIYRHSSGVSLTPRDVVIPCCVEVAFDCGGDLGSVDRSGDTEAFRFSVEDRRIVDSQ